MSIKDPVRLDLLRNALDDRREIEAAFLDVMRAYDSALEIQDATQLSGRRADEIWALYERLTER